MFAKTTSTINTVNATNRFLTSEKTDPKESGGWKDNLMSKFKTTVHCRNSHNFEEQIGRYIKGDVSISPGNLSWLVVGCMKYREVEVLKELLMHENINALTISGSHESGGWETLIAGMPDTFAGTVLKLLAVPLNSGTGKLLFDVLSRMSKLDALFLNKVAVGNSVSELDGEALKRIKTLDVVADDYSDNDVLPLLFKIVENCELRAIRREHARFCQRPRISGGGTQHANQAEFFVLKKLHKRESFRQFHVIVALQQMAFGAEVDQRGYCNLQLQAR